MSNQPKKIYSVGTSIRSETEFMELMKTYSIKTVVDVRRFPTSNLGHFKRENLEGVALNEPTVFVCAERLPWRCHRRFIGNALKNRGRDV